ncbi:hypothetical protein [Deferribacter abyssi]|uniref:hypothetical protein n=1 Tax=Deferribacter abyssi TaxID=213806 RepID=UPI003C1BDC73
MAKNAAEVKMGYCDVSFDGQDIGYTKGGTRVSYSVETVEITADQEDAPIGEVVTKQNFEVTVPIEQYNLQLLAKLIPGATLVVDATDSTKMKLEIAGASGVNLLDLAKELKIIPRGGDANDQITVHHAVPIPKIEFAYEKDNVRVYEVTFKALKGTNGFVTFGDTTTTA